MLDRSRFTDRVAFSQAQAASGFPPAVALAIGTVHAPRAALAQERIGAGVPRYTLCLGYFRRSVISLSRLFPSEGVPETAHQARLGRAPAVDRLEQVEALTRRAYDRNTEAVGPREHALVGFAPDEDGARARLGRDVHATLEAVVDDDVEIERQGDRPAAASRGVDAGKIESVPSQPQLRLLLHRGAAGLRPLGDEDHLPPPPVGHPR